MNRDQAIIFLPVVIFLLGFTVYVAAWMIARAIWRGCRVVKVVFSLGDLEREALLTTIKEDPIFLQAFVDWAGDKIKGPPGDAANPKDVALQITSNSDAMSLLKNGLITHCMAQVAQAANMLLEQFREGQQRLLDEPIADLQAVQADLGRLREDCENVRTLTTRAAQYYQDIMDATAALRATAAQFDELIRTSEILQRLLGPAPKAP